MLSSELTGVQPIGLYTQNLVEQGCLNGCFHCFVTDYVVLHLAPAQLCRALTHAARATISAASLRVGQWQTGLLSGTYLA